jgi:high-affinity iron transporter
MYFNVSWLSQLSEGFGMELIEALVLIGFSLLVTSKICFPHPSNYSPYIIGGTMVLLMIPNTLNFAIYATAYWPSQDQNMALLLGIILGLGISSSLACIIYLVLKTSVLPSIIRTLLVIFSAGQVAEAANLLEQIDCLPSTPDLWDSSWLVTDQSEYGHLLRVFWGYEANPSVYYLLFFCAALLLPYATKYAIRK